MGPLSYMRTATGLSRLRVRKQDLWRDEAIIWIRGYNCPPCPNKAVSHVLAQEALRQEKQSDLLGLKSGGLVSDFMQGVDLNAGKGDV